MLELIKICFYFILTISFAFFSMDAKANVCSKEKNELIYISGGTLKVGNNPIYPEEVDGRVVEVSPFKMSRFEVTNQEFTEFVKQTGYITQAEKSVSAKQYPNVPAAQRIPGSAVFRIPKTSAIAPINQDWWKFVEGANWRNPQGPGSSIEGKERHPVIHITYVDAKAYANWKGHRLPTAEEFEYVAYYGQSDEHDVVNSNSLPKRANTWQGDFPFNDSGEDGYTSTAPVGCYSPNYFGIFDIIGNVWEWTSTPYHFKKAKTASSKTRAVFAQSENNEITVKGGSFLCAPDFCARFRPAAKIAQERLLGTSHIGFRTVIDVKME